MTHWKRLRENTYLGQHDFDPGEKKTLTVARVVSDQVTDDKGRKKKEPIMHFSEAVKPMIMNATNCRKMEEISGSRYVEQWAGIRIVVSVDPSVVFGKKVVGGLRIVGRVSAPAQGTSGSKPILCQDCSRPITAYGEMTPAQVAERAQARFGARLCMNCGKRRLESNKDDGGNHGTDEK